MRKPTNGLDKRPQDINKAGRPRLSKTLRAVKEFETSEIIEAFNKVIGLTIKQAESMKIDPETLLLEKSLIDVMQKGQISVITDRLLGRAPESITIENKNKYSDMSKEDLEKEFWDFFEEKIKGDGEAEKRTREILTGINNFRIMAGKTPEGS